MATSEKFDVTFGAGSMGFGVETPENQEEGSVVTEVVEGSVADKGGVKVDDFLIGIGDEDITHLDHESTVELIVEAERPVVLHFERVTKANVTTGDDNKNTNDDNAQTANETKKEEKDNAQTVATTNATPFPVLDAEDEIIEIVKEYMKNMSKEEAKEPVNSVEKSFTNALKSADVNGGNSLDKNQFEKCITGLAVSADLIKSLMEKVNASVGDNATISYQEFLDFVVECARKIPPRGKRRGSGGMFSTLGIVKGFGSRWKKKALSTAAKKKKDEAARKERLSRVADASTDAEKSNALLLEVVNDKENKIIDSSIVEEVTTLLDHAHDDQERVDILTIVINGKDVSSEIILEQCNDAEVRSIHRLADHHHEEKKKGERTPTPIESDSDIDAFDEESDEEHPEMDDIQALLQEKTKGYVKKAYVGVDKNADDYVDPDWLITKDEEFSDDDPFDDMGNDADAEYRELAMEDAIGKYKNGLETMHKSYSQMPGSDKTQHHKAIKQTFDSIGKSKTRLGVVPFLRLCKDFNLITRKNKVLQNSRAGVGYEDIAMIEWIAAKDDPILSENGKLPIERDEAKKIFKKVAGKQNQYNFVEPHQLMKVFFQMIMVAWPRMNATSPNHEREQWSNTALKTFRKVVKNERWCRPQYRTLRKNGAIEKLLRRIRAAKTTKKKFHFEADDIIEAEVIENYTAPKEELDAFEGDVEDDAPFHELYKGDKIRILALQNDDDDEQFFNENDEYEAWLPIRKDLNAKFQVEKKTGQYWLGQQMTVKGEKVVDDYAHFEHRGTLPASAVRILRVYKENALTPDVAATKIQQLSRGSMYRIRRRRIWDAATKIENMVRAQQQRKRYRRALHVRNLQASCVIERLLDKQPDFPKLYTMLERLKIRNKREAIDSTIARSRGFVFAQGNFQDDTPGNLGQRKHDAYRHFTKDTKDPPRKRREAPVYTGKFAKGKPDRVRGDIPKHDPKMDTCQDLFSYGLQQLYKAYCSTFGTRKLARDPTFEKMGEIQNTINLQGFAAICTDFKLVQPTFKGAKMATLYIDNHGDIRFTEEGHMSFTREFLKATYQRWCVYHQDPKDTHTAIRSWKNLADILAELAWESYKKFCKTDAKFKGMKRPEVAAALYTRMCLAEDDSQVLHNLLMGFGRGMTFPDGKHPGIQEKYVYQMMKYSTKGATHPVDRMRVALHERKARGMDIKSLFTHLDEESYGWEHPSGILKPESMWKALGIILEANLITKVEWNLQVLPYLMENFKGMENARASGIYKPQAGIDYVKFSEWVNQPLPNFHHEGHGKMLESTRHRHRVHYTKRASGSHIRRDEYGNALGKMTEEEYQEMQRESKTPPPIYDPEDDVIGRAFGKNSGYHDHWDASGVDDHFNADSGNSQFGLPMVDQVMMNNNMPPHNSVISQMPVPPKKPNMGGNKDSPLVRRTQLV